MKIIILFFTFDSSSTDPKFCKHAQQLVYEAVHKWRHQTFDVFDHSLPIVTHYVIFW